MSVVLKKYEGSATLEDLGNVKSIAGKGGTIDFLDKNFADLGKRVVVLVKNKAGESGVIACSQGLSKNLREAKTAGKSRKELLGWVAGLNVLENEDGQYFITMPSSGEAREGINVDSLKIVDTSAIIDIGALAAW
jgi:hypothetical protein